MQRWTTKPSPGSWLSYPNLAGAITLLEGGGAPTDTITNSQGVLSGTTAPTWDRPEPTDLRPTVLFSQSNTSLNSYANFGAKSAFLNLGNNTPMTLIARVRWTGGRGGIAERNGAGTGWAWGVGSNNIPMFLKVQSTGTQGRESGATPLTSGAWITLAVTYEGEAAGVNGGSILNYLDGVLLAGANVRTGSGTNQDDSAASFRVGNSAIDMPGIGNPTMIGSFGGQIAWVLAFNRVLSADELKTFNYVRNVPTALWERFSGPRRARYVSSRPDGWDIWVNGTSVKDKVEQKSAISIKLDRGELSELRFRTRWSENYVPDQFLEVYAFDDDGLELFGGIVRFRDVSTVGSTSRSADVTCHSWWFYLTVTLVSVESGDPITMKEIIVLALAQVPSEYGIVLDLTQPDGPTLDSFSTGGYVKASELFRRLQADTADLGSYVPDLTALKVFSMFPAGTVAASLSLTDAQPNCRTASWKDSNETPANHILLTCGTARVADYIRHTWPTCVGGETVFALNDESDDPGIRNIPSTSTPPGVLRIDGADKPMALPDTYGPNDIEWNYTLNGGTATLHGTSAALISASSVVSLNYQPMFPFTVEATTGATPRISEPRTNDTIETWADAQVAVTALLAQLGQATKELEVFSLETVWRPSQALTVALTQLDLDAVFTIGQVTIIKKYDQWWESRFSAQDTTIPPPSRMERTRSLIAAMAGRS